MQNIIIAHATKNLCYIAARKMIPQGIVVHTTGANNPYLKRYVDAPEIVGKNTYKNHWNQPKPDGRSVCVHAFIGYDNNKKIRIAEILPLNICCWGVGKGRKGTYNYDPAYIQFEICEDGLTDEKYYREAFAIAAEYCAKLCQKYGISVNNIVGHCEAYKQGYGSNHCDPEHWMKKYGETMENFRQRVAQALNNETEQTATENKENAEEIRNGDLVSILDNAVYFNGKKIPDWVLKQNWFVADINKNGRVIIDKNESNTNSIFSPIHKDFVKLVKKETDSNIFSPYLVKVTASALNIRQSAGVDSLVVGTITDRGVYTIVEEKAGKGAKMWGKLKSGAGWIALDYTNKI